MPQDMERKRRWTLAHKELVRSYGRHHYQVNKQQIRLERRGLVLKRHNISRAEFDRIYEAQEGRCDICARPFDLTAEGRTATYPKIDHDHDTEQVRGLLCGRCNLALGLFGDNPMILLLAKAYLDNWVDRRIKDFAVTH